MNNPTPKDAPWVYACPDCDRAGQLNEREDKTVICYDCGNVVERKRRLVKRSNRRGCNLTREDKLRFAKNPDVIDPGARASDSEPSTPGPDPKYADLTLDDVGLESD